MTSAYVRALTGNHVDTEQIDAIYDSISNQLLHRIRNVGEYPQLIVPFELQHVVDELTIARFNYIGSEGLKSETVEGSSATYATLTFTDFDKDIQDYIRDNTDIKDAKNNVVRFI